MYMYISTMVVILFATLLIIPFLISSTHEGRIIIDQLLYVPKKVILNLSNSLEIIIEVASGKTKGEEQEIKLQEQYVADMERLSKRVVRLSAFQDKLFYVTYYFIPLAGLFLIAQGLALGRFLLFNSYTSSLNHIIRYSERTVSMPSICLKAMLYQEYFHIS